MPESIKLDTVEEAIADIRDGKFVIVVDDEDRENEGDLIIAAEKITPEQVNFMLMNARGVLCAPITRSRWVKSRSCSRISVSSFFIFRRKFNDFFS